MESEIKKQGVLEQGLLAGTGRVRSIINFFAIVSSLKNKLEDGLYVALIVRFGTVLGGWGC